MNDKLRTIQRKEIDEWVEVRLSRLKKGDTFRYMECGYTDEGEALLNQVWSDEHVCESDAEQADNGVWGVQILTFETTP